MAKNRFFDRSMLIFLLIGLGNTLLSQGVMQGLYALGAGYWWSSAIAFALTALLSYALNKRFSFRNTDSVGSTLWRFALVVAACYLLAYSLARPLTASLLRRFLPAAEESLVEKLAMLTGQVLYTGLNYLGQRFFAFRQRP